MTTNTKIFKSSSMVNSSNKRIIRPLVYQDTPTIIELDKNCFTPPFSEQTIKEVVSNIYYSFKVLEVDGSIIGYSVYQFRKYDIVLYKVGVNPNFRCKGYGALLLRDVYKKMTVERNKILCYAAETSDDAINWLKRMGFVATAVRKSMCFDGSDAYCFRLVLPESIIKSNNKE